MAKAHDLILHIARQTGGDAVDVNFLSVAAFGFQKNLMRRLIGEPHDFVFD